MENFMLPQSYAPYESFTYDECKPNYWPEEPMNDFIAWAYGKLPAEYDVDGFKLLIMNKWQNLLYSPTSQDVKEVAAEGQTIDFNDYGNFIQQRHNEIDVLFFLKILERETEKPVEEMSLYNRFVPDEYENDVTFSVPAMNSNRRHSIWYDNKTLRYRDVVTGEKAFIGSFESMAESYIQSYAHGNSKSQVEAAEKRGRFGRTCMVTALLLDEKAWRPGSEGLFKGLNPDRLMEAGIRFCNHDLEDAKDFPWFSTSIGEEGPGPGKKARTSSSTSDDPDYGIRKLRVL